MDQTPVERQHISHPDDEDNPAGLASLVRRGEERLLGRWGEWRVTPAILIQTDKNLTDSILEQIADHQVNKQTNNQPVFSIYSFIEGRTANR